MVIDKYEYFNDQKMRNHANRMEFTSDQIAAALKGERWDYGPKAQVIIFNTKG